MAKKKSRGSVAQSGTPAEGIVDGRNEKMGGLRPRIVAGSSMVTHRAIVTPNGKWLLCICGGEVKIYCCASGDLLSELYEDNDRAGASNDSDPLTAISFNAVSPHSQIYAVSRRGRLVLWNYEDGIAVKKVELGREVHGIYSPYRTDGKGEPERGLYLLTSSTSNHVKPSGVAQSINQSKNGGVESTDVDTSCHLLHLSSLESVSSKKGWRSVMRGISSDYQKIAFDPEGDFVAVVSGNALCLHLFKDQLYKRHLMEGRQFTVVAVHPKERCIATGDTQGRILLWRCFEEHARVTRSILHWHSSAVKDLAFSPEGSYLWSGGSESTLVQWSLIQPGEKDFIPRMGAPILHLSISFDKKTIVVSHADNVITLVGLQRNIICRVSSLYCSLPSATSSGSQDVSSRRALLASEPINDCLVLGGKAGQLQLYHPLQDKLFPPIEVVQQNVMSSGLEGELTNANVDAVAFGGGRKGKEESWMCTADSLFMKHVGSAINLKFWQFVQTTRKYMASTSVIDPHDGQPVRWILFSPYSEEALVVTLSDDNFKVWMASQEKTLIGSRTVWSCIGLGHLKGYQPSACAFSPDGTTLAVAFKHLLTFWNVDTVTLRQSLLIAPPTSAFIRNIAYGPAGSDSFLVTTDVDVTFWKVATMTVVSTHSTPGSFLTSDSSGVVCAVCGSQSVAVLDWRTMRVLYQYTFPTQLQIVACLLSSRVREARPEGRSEQSPECYEKEGLHLLSAKGELWTVHNDEGARSGGRKKLSLLEDDPLTPYAHLKATALNESKALHSLSNGFPQTRKESFVERMMTVPAYTLPKAEYFLTEHINSLLGLTEAPHVPEEEEEGEKGERENDEEEDEDMPEAVRELSKGADQTPVKEQLTPLDHNFDFLAHSVKLLKSVSPLKKGGHDKTSVYAVMSQLYDKMRTDQSP